MARMVKCFYCGQMFNREAEPFVRIGERRYAHKDCAEKYAVHKTKEEQDLDDLRTYIKHLYHQTTLSTDIERQIAKYRHDYGYTYSGMLKTLIYWYDIKGNTLEKSQGRIGIIPYVYEDANEYYYNLFLAQQRNQNKNIEAFKQPKVDEITIPPPSASKRKRRLFFEGDDTK